MSWFGGGKKSEKGRKRQIQSLEAKDGKAYKMYKMSKNHYRVTFRCRGFDDALAIQIHLTDDFPESAPKISVDRKYSHHLLDDNGVVTKLPDLQKWSVHSDLGSIVQKITNIFNTSAPTIKQSFPGTFQKPSGAQSHPQPSWGQQGPPSYQDHVGGGGGMGDRAQSQPMGRNSNLYPQGGGGGGAIAQSHSMHSYPYGGNNYGGGGGGPPNYNQNHNQNQHSWHGGGGGGGGGARPGMNQNDIDMNRRSSQHQAASPTTDLASMKLSPPSIIPGFAEKTYTELEEMDKEPKLVEDFAYTVATTLRELKKESQNGCMSTASKNIAANESIRELIKKNDEMRANVETLTELYKNLKKREAVVLQKFSVPNIMNKLDAEMDKIDEQCEGLKDKFQTKDEKTPLVIYVKRLALMRANYHMLAIKKEKLEKLQPPQHGRLGGGHF